MTCLRVLSHKMEVASSLHPTAALRPLPQQKQTQSRPHTREPAATASDPPPPYETRPQAPAQDEAAKSSSAAQGALHELWRPPDRDPILTSAVADDEQEKSKPDSEQQKPVTKEALAEKREIQRGTEASATPTSLL